MTANPASSSPNMPYARWSTPDMRGPSLQRLRIVMPISSHGCSPPRSLALPSLIGRLLPFSLAQIDPPRSARTKCSVAPPSSLYSSAVLSSFLHRELSAFCFHGHVPAFQVLHSQADPQSPNSPRPQSSLSGDYATTAYVLTFAFHQR